MVTSSFVPLDRREQKKTEGGQRAKEGRKKRHKSTEFKSKGYGTVKTPEAKIKVAKVSYQKL